MSTSHVSRGASPFALGLWFGVGALALFSLYTLAMSRGEPVNAMWLVAAAVGVYAIGYRFYSRFIAERVLRPALVTVAAPK